MAWSKSTLMSVKLRSVYAGKFYFAANHQTTGTAHTGSVYHDRVHADNGRNIQLLWSVRQTNFIMIIGPIATHRSYSLPWFCTRSAKYVSTHTFAYHKNHHL